MTAGAATGERAAHPRHRATVVAVGLMAVNGAFWLVQGVSMVVLGLTMQTRSAVNFQLVEAGFGRAEGEVLLVASGVLVVAFSLTYVATTLGVLSRRSWARDAGIFLSGAFGLLLTVMGIGGLFADPAMRDAPLAVLGGLLNLTVLGLMLSRPFIADLELAEHRRRRAAVSR